MQGRCSLSPFLGIPEHEALWYVSPVLHWFSSILTGNVGRNQLESILGMLNQYPFMNEYWEDKRAAIENIEVPAYVLASYSTGLHTVGSFRGFEDIKHSNKW